MRLIIAEKPSLARAIAAALPGPSRPAKTHIACGSSDIVAWCAGHVLELASPEEYSPGLKPWLLETLPIVPERWQLRASRPELVGAIERLLGRAARVVHAGDPDREGQLLVDELLEHLGWKGPTERLLLTDLSPDAVRRALDALEPNALFRPLYAAALARQRADWLFGINLTRLYTLRARLGGYEGVLSVGRVQTPLLGLIVRRDREIEAFVAKPFYGVRATLRTADAAEFHADWVVGEEHEAFTDSEGRLVSRAIADAIARKTMDASAVVRSYEEKPRSEAAPLPYSLAELQVDGGRKLGLTASQVLELAQSLYEQQLITYPRSDCSYLPEAHWSQAKDVVAAIGALDPRLAGACELVDLRLRSKAWNDGKVTAHHAIIPTARGGPSPASESERALYELIAVRYLQQFAPPFEFLAVKAELDIGGERFTVQGRRVTAPGWKVLERQSAAPEGEKEEGAGEEVVLPRLEPGQRLRVLASAVREQRTQPPKAFTDAGLIQAMVNIAKYVEDPKAKQILRATDGIGTPATRAAIIETLFERRYVERRKKQIRSTPLGRAFIDALPAVTVSPDLTAIWESAMRRIQDGELSLDRFLDVVVRQTSDLVAQGKQQGTLKLPPPSAPKRARQGARRGRKSGRREVTA